MGANFAVRRRLFDAIGGFDERLGCGGPLRAGEDFDFAYRTYRSGAAILLRPDVSLLHDGRRERSEWPGLVRNYGIGDGAFYSKHIRCGDWRAMQMLSATRCDGWGRGWPRSVSSGSGPTRTSISAACSRASKKGCGSGSIDRPRQYVAR